MAFQHELRRGLTASEATLVITGLGEQYNSFSEATYEIYEEIAIDEAQYGKGSHNITQYKVLNIHKALLDEISIACGHLKAKQNNAIAPIQSTVIKLLFETTFDNNINSIEMTKESIAIWLQGYDPDKSILFDPTKSYLLPLNYLASAKENPFENDDMDNYLYIALGVYKQCWEDLPPNMKNPTRLQVREYINTVVGELPNSVVEAIITLCAPQYYDFQNRTSTGTEVWKPLFKRKGGDQ